MQKKIKEKKQAASPKTIETPGRRLSGIIKSCRNIMRKDKGMNGDGDRLPMLTWIMFLKFLDDNEQLQEPSGSGTLKIISTCKEAGLPDPEIIEQDGGILVTLFKNKYSTDQLQKLRLNERQVKAVPYVVENGSITSSVYQKNNDVGRTAAAMDLQELVTKGILLQLGLKGRGIKYVLSDN